MSVYEIYAKMEFYNFILSRKIDLNLMAEFARLNSADLAAGAACGEILRRIWRFDLEFHERMLRENFIFIWPRFC